MEQALINHLQIWVLIWRATGTFDDEACKEASEQEIIRRYYKCLKDIKQFGHTKDDKFKLELLDETGRNQR